MPPSVASAPGSIGKNRPVSRKYSLSCLRVTPASTVASRSAELTRTIRFIGDESFERGTRAERYDWYAALGAKLDDRCNFVSAASEGDRIGGVRHMVGLI